MIPEMMNAIVKTQKERGAEYKQVPVPKIEPDEALVKIHAAAICGTDIHVYQWNAWAAANMEKAYSGLPRIMGHEFSGELVAVGSAVTNAKVGDRHMCKTGDSYNCQNIRRFKNGIYAEYAVVPAAALVKLPDTMSYDVASVMEPFSVATHGAGMVRMVGDTVAVVGAGPIGLFTVKIARAMGAARIFVADISEFRLDLAKTAGADIVINSSQTDVVQEIKQMTGGLGCGTVFETSGNAAAVKQAFQFLRKCGAMIMTGLPSQPIVLDASDDIVWKAAKVFGVHGREIFTSWEISKGLLGSGRVTVDDMLTHRFKFSEFKTAFELAEAGLTGKVILHPDALAQ